MPRNIRQKESKLVVRRPMNMYVRKPRTFKSERNIQVRKNIQAESSDPIHKHVLERRLRPRNKSQAEVR
jgi:hypothetical protein